MVLFIICWPQIHFYHICNLFRPSHIAILQKNRFGHAISPFSSNSIPFVTHNLFPIHNFFFFKKIPHLNWEIIWAWNAYVVSFAITKKNIYKRRKLNGRTSYRYIIYFSSLIFPHWQRTCMPNISMNSKWENFSPNKSNALKREQENEPRKAISPIWPIQNN